MVLRNILIASFLLMAQFSFGQASKWSIEVNYPLPVGTGLYNDFHGIADVGVKYRFLEIPGLIFGASVNYFQKVYLPRFNMII